MRKKLIRVTTSDISLDSLLKGQLRYLSRHFDVVALSNDTGKLRAVGEREGVRVIEVPMHREVSLKSDIACLWRLYAVFRRERPDIIHANTPKGSLLAMAAGWLAGVRHRLYTVTGLRYQGASGLFRVVLKSMERITCLFATKVIPEGRGVSETLQRDHITRKPLKVILNGNINGIDTAYFSPARYTVGQRTGKYTGSREQIRQDLGFAAADFVFIFIGRIVRDKGMNELAECMKGFQKTHPRLKLLLVGRFENELDPIDNSNEFFFKTSTNVFFQGYQDDVRPYLLASDALVFPSYREGFPNVVMQAGAMGLPSIVTDINGSNEIVENKTNGIIIPPKDREALRDAMACFCENRNETRTMASKARKMIVDRYQQEGVWNAILEEYRNL